MTAGDIELALFVNDLTSEQFSVLRQGSGLDALDSELMERGLKNSLLAMRCEVEGKTCGMLRVVGDGAFVLVLCDILVLPEYRGRGIGTLMINAAMDRVRGMMPVGKWVPLLLTCAHEREDFYYRLGFRPLDGGVQGISMQTFLKGTKTFD